MLETIAVYTVIGLLALMILVLIVCEFHDLIKFVWSKVWTHQKR